MNAKIRARLATLKTDFESLTGRELQHFFCPILHRDEEVELCRGHIVNTCFKNSDRSWTVQRSDVDSFYGRLMENELSVLQLRDYKERHGALAALIDKEHYKKLRPQIQFNGESVDYYLPNGPIPREHTRILLEDDKNYIHIAVKAELDQIPVKGRCQIHIDKDVSLQALVSLIKAAHLTMFHLLRYRYALSATGYFLGRKVLGEFFLSCQDLQPTEHLEYAHEHFGKLKNLVRPIISSGLSRQGTVTDGFLDLCIEGGDVWASIVIVRTGQMLHAILLPALDTGVNCLRFEKFLDHANPSLTVRGARINKGSWELYPGSQRIDWPEVQFGADRQPSR